MEVGNQKAYPAVEPVLAGDALNHFILNLKYIDNSNTCLYALQFYKRPLISNLCEPRLSLIAQDICFFKSLTTLFYLLDLLDLDMDENTCNIAPRSCDYTCYLHYKAPCPKRKREDNTIKHGMFLTLSATDGDLL